MVADALLRSLKHVWTTLEPLGMPMAITGGIALASWEHVRATQDVDILIAIGDTNVTAMLDRLRKAHIRPKHTPALRSLGQIDLLQLLYEPPGTFLDLQIDLLIARSAYHEQALERCVTTRLDDLGLEVAVVACEDLILLKLLAGRIIDRADAAAILRTNHSSLDLTYLAHWVGKLDLAQSLTEIWREALPDETPLASSKSQIANHKLQTNSNDRNPNDQNTGDSQYDLEG